MPRTLAQNAQYIAETIKPAIKSAIEAQGVTVPSTDSFLDYADRIGEIEGGGSGYQLKDLPTGSISTVNDAVELPLNALKVSVEAWQEGSGDPSPSNVRPIHGWDSGEITTDAGVNLLGDANNWNINASGSIVSSGSYSTYTAQIEQGCSYKFTQTGTGNIIYAFYFDTPAIGSSSYNSSRTIVESANIAVITAPINGYVAIRTDKNTVSNQVLKRANVYTHAFTDAQGNPLTVYGAEWDVVGGGMKQTHKVVDLGACSWGYDANGYFTTYSVPECAGAVYNQAFDGLCEEYKANSVARVRDGSTIGIASNQSHVIFVRDTRFNNETDFTNAMQGVKLVYAITTPTAIQLSPLSIRMLQGTNNIFADCGDVIEGEYFVDEGAHRYQLYDYIESDGTQVIDLGRQVVSGQTIKTVFHPMSNQVAYSWLFGAGDASHYYGFQLPQQTTLLVYNGSTSSSGQMSVNTADEYVYNLDFTASDSLTLNYYAFGINYNDTPGGNNLGKFRLYSFSINGDDYLPCKRRSDGKYGLYDVANSQFLTDSASGNAFVGGNPTGVEV